MPVESGYIQAFILNTLCEVKTHKKVYHKEKRVALCSNPACSFHIYELYMDRVTFRTVGSFHQSFAEGWVSVNIPGNLRCGELHHLGNGQLWQ